jgi:MSHA biogenesis protein MshJ
MMNALKNLLAKGDALTPRERGILFLLLLTVIWAAMDMVFMTPLQRERKLEAERIQSAQERILKAEEALSRQAHILPPDVAARQRLEAARLAYQARLQALSSLQRHLVAPRDMVQVLQDLTRTKPGLRLLALQSLAPEALGDEVKPGADAKPGGGSGLYRQGVTLTLAGSYADLVDYMLAVERLPVGFYWGKAELDAREHPHIRLSLTLFTLSLEREWIKL